ncbi:MAG: alpha/beta fold hydrolase [Akkermansiaceae bacterium]|nr:alpha/beta fold hydrolase [Akkermansiaceae bacterium]
MSFIRKRWRSILFALFFLIIFAVIGGIYLAGLEIASPPRRALVDYHHEYLSNSVAHGILIEKFTASDGTPCLVCVPEPNGMLGSRGIKIREQLLARGLTLQPPGKMIGNLVLNHGRKGRKEDYLPIAERLCAAGFRCIIPDLPAHGDHPTKLATYGVREAGINTRILSEAAQKFHFDQQPTGLLGMSMGGSVAIHDAALADSPWKALVIISSFDFIPNVIESQASSYVGDTLGRSLASGAAFVYQQKTSMPLTAIEPRSHAVKIKIPTLIAHGTGDQVIPLSCGRALFNSFSNAADKKWIEIPGANHDNVLVTDYPIYAEIAEWMLRYVAEN